MPNKIKKRRFLDWGILIPYLFLTVIGLMMVYSTTSYVLLEDGDNPARQAIFQFIFWFISLLLIFIIYRLKTEVLKSKKLTFAALIFVSFLLLVAFAFKPVNGAYGWIQIPGMGTIQPVEFFKLVVVWFFSTTLARQQNHVQAHFLTSIKGSLFAMVIPTVMLLLYPDFGNAAIVVLIVLILLLASGVNYLYTLYGGLIGIVGSVLAILGVNTFGKYFLPNYVLSRFAVFRNPFIDEYGDGHQMIHGYYALFNGGLFGRGLGNSIQKKGFLQFAHTDYAFAIVVEELGLIVAILILGALFYMIARILLIGIRSKDPFNSIMCIGIASLFLISIFINLGGITGIIPLTGITFPFISQGGSSLMMFSICIGFVLNISADEKKKAMLNEM
ncbi:FtsW/RodA/SpoVE family cell cycle protein [Tetragenococcus solitarius]|uniref:Probable peptidoglycan glycosyltransferase FtsW n=1 Tax=Tetragenococcus solitarius TaxID=71453 RepID=A0ABN3Y8I1_9ENTE|nr:FtsW/RodA/SpoVE family cell cycle protein [Tetragenococcus solitarius]